MLDHTQDQALRWPVWAAQFQFWHLLRLEDVQMLRGIVSLLFRKIEPSEAFIEETVSDRFVTDCEVSIF